MHSHIALSELQRLVRTALDERFPLPLWISAEIAELKVNYSGHCYLELVEKGGDNGIPTAQARAVVWRSHYPRIAADFEAATGRPLAAGMRILARASVSYHELYGFSLRIIDIDPSYTLGEMERLRQETIDRLRREGVWEMNRSLAMPLPVQRVAVVSSAQAAGYRDFRKELERSPYRIEHRLFDAFMQGEAAEDSIIAALCAVADAEEPFDAVAILRGGGSASDLNCFNSYRLCSYVAQFPLPVITGIGHDKDTSVADMVAHTPLKTPTAVAVWLSERAAQAAVRLDEASQRLHDAVILLVRDRERTLQRLGGELASRSAALAAREQGRIDTLSSRLPAEAAALVARCRERLAAAEALAESRSPRHILRLGFAVVRRDGRAVISAHDIHSGQKLEIEVADGRFEVEAK